MDEAAAVAREATGRGRVAGGARTVGQKAASRWRRRDREKLAWGLAHPSQARARTWGSIRLMASTLRARDSECDRRRGPQETEN